MPITCVPLVPKDPSGPLNVVAMGRISTVHQDIENIEASHRYIQEYLGHIYQGPIQITLLGEQASGMLTDRPTIWEAEALVASGKVDLVIAEGIEPGPYVEGGRWTARLVVELLDDPILSGTRTFRDTICRPVFKTGKHKRVRNAEPETEHCPELAHLGAEEHELLRQEIARRRAMRKTAGPPKRRGIPRSRTLWPGQAAVCGACGGAMYYSGKHLRCRNSLPRFGGSCWNHVQFSAELARGRICGWLAEFLNGKPDLRPAMVDLVWEELDRPRRRAERNRPDLGREIASLERQAANLTAAIAEGGQLNALLQKLEAVEAALEKARAAKAMETTGTEVEGKLPSKQHIERSLAESMQKLAASSFEFSAVLRRIFPRFSIQPVQALDCGQVRPRAKLLFRPDAIDRVSASDAGASEDPEGMPVVLDLFEPPLHVRHLPRCLVAKQANPGLSLKRIAKLLGLGHMTVKRALGYARLMEQARTSDPYCEIHVGPVDASRWRMRPAMASPVATPASAH